MKLAGNVDRKLITHILTLRINNKKTQMHYNSCYINGMLRPNIKMRVHMWSTCIKEMHKNFEG